MSLSFPSRVPAPRGTRPGGFTLIELMVALVVGLVVILAAVSFLVSIAKANSEDIQVTRLTQELRALSEVTSREIRRARYVADPIGLVAQGGLGNHDRLDVYDLDGDISDNECIVFEYDEPPDPPVPGGLVTRSIRLEGGRVFLNPVAGGGVDCAGGSAISSPEIEITDLVFEHDAAADAFRVDMTVTGRLDAAVAPPALEGMTRSFRQTIYVRSGKVN